MKSRKKTLYTILKPLALIGLAAGLIITLQFAGRSILLTKGDNGKSLAAYPPPEAARSDTPGLALKPTPARSATPTPLVLENGWYRYNDPDGAFSFAYPPDALVNAGQNPVASSINISIQFKIPDMSYQGMSIRLEPNQKRLTAADIAIQLYEKSAQRPAPAELMNSLQPIIIGGKSAVQVSIPSTNTEVTVIIPYDDTVFIVSPLHDSAVTKVDIETLEVFYQILNTFEFGISK